jgi:hypothetical protein
MRQRKRPAHKCTLRESVQTIDLAQSIIHLRIDESVNMVVGSSPNVPPAPPTATAPAVIPVTIICRVEGMKELPDNLTPENITSNTFLSLN